ncbi:MAG: hypothetical protein OCC45_02425 [Desulfotalea sp.]
MKLSSIDILEKYIEGKDKDKYQILEEIYADNAIVKFEIKSDQISFPNEIVGNIEIAKVLSADFNKKYTDVKTYYLSKPESNQRHIYGQKWLVVMKDNQFDKTRVGTGYYDWEITNSGSKLEIFKHKIYIHEMLELADVGSKKLKNIQRKLEYPFVELGSVVSILQSYLELENIEKYMIEIK